MFKAGFSKVDITPPLGSPIAGYYRLRIADGILDPLDLIAVAFNDGESTAVVISADFIGFHEVVGPIGEADNTVRLVRFKREDANDIALVNFSTHPDVIGGTKFSADWPGFARRFVEKDLEGVSCILINGPQGDTNHSNIHDRKRGYEHSRHMGRVIADTVVNIWDKTEPKNACPITAQYKLEHIPTSTKYIERIEEYTEMKKQYLESAIKLSGMELRADIYRVASLYDETIFQKVPVSVLGMGEIVLAGFGGEAFTQYAKVCRDAAPEHFVMSACLLNGDQGYFPTTEAYEQGGYEASSSPFQPCLAEQLLGAAIEMINKHKNY